MATDKPLETRLLEAFVRNAKWHGQTLGLSAEAALGKLNAICTNMLALDITMVHARLSRLWEESDKPSYDVHIDRKLLEACIRNAKWFAVQQSLDHQVAIAKIVGICSGTDVEAEDAQTYVAELWRKLPSPARAFPHQKIRSICWCLEKAQPPCTNA